MSVVIARVRVLLPALGAVLIVVGTLADAVVPTVVGFATLVIGMACYFVLGAVRAEPVRVRLPVSGRWVAVNSPANRVPSHGLHAYGQTYALDLVHEPGDPPRPSFGSGHGFRRPAEFPAFGQPVLAPADGVVVRVHDRQRDHRSRNSWPGLVWLLVEGSARELLGPSRLLGNHVVLDLGAGVYAALAHLRRGSVRVAVGDAVRAGERLAGCGNSGNSTEPHLHVQLMDHPRVLVAAGLPVTFETYEVDGRRCTGVPANGEPFVVPE
ncbi:MAG: M23 family metallopeptidase [Pseudonocardiaceae bacterium]